ncbi:hypothetical protein [Acinetobacter sp. 809848]|uniref:hypothetical protein n=2 Tax=Acinetobacter sp. 809848 TaxID=1310637 RepID=UPI00045028EC|nr:hypothetical protein [Acinetobacter sp. 809848]EXC25539.1 hypothetical protein J536_3528 [Acinetobacter sp. 809848]
MNTDSITPLYLNWGFWSFLVALVALIISLFPHIRIWLKGNKLDLEIHNKITLHHWVGFPSINIYLGVTNKGRARVKIKSMNVKIVKDGRDIENLSCNGYFESTTSQSANLFFPFELSSDESWDHVCWFAINLDRNKEQKARSAFTAVDMNISEKIRVNGANNQLVEANSELVDTLKEIHSQNFIWDSGEYYLELRFETIPSIILEKRVRFTLFESDVKELNDYFNDYKFGSAYNHQKNKGVNILISEASN